MQLLGKKWNSRQGYKDCWHTDPIS